MSSLLSVIEYRAAEPQDYHLILDSWIKTYRTSPYAGVVAADKFHEMTRDTIEQLLSRGAKVQMAVADDDREQIIGYVCYEVAVSGVAVVHYVYVKGGKSTAGAELFRGKGLGRALLVQATKGAPFIYTFRTRDGDRLARNGHGRHVPHIGRRKHLEPVRRIEGVA